jgi:hypothetical protein
VIFFLKVWAFFCVYWTILEVCVIFWAESPKRHGIVAYMGVGFFIGYLNDVRGSQ